MTLNPSLLFHSLAHSFFQILPCSAVALVASVLVHGQIAPLPDEQQLPDRMHSRMLDKPVIHVGQKGADFIGGDHRILQAAMDYVSGLG